MEDPKLNQQLEYCQSLLKLWQEFHLFISDCTDHTKQFTQEDEAQFLKVKSQIAILYDTFFESLHEADRETIATAQAIITVVENCILLRQVQRMSPAELKRMEIEWHEAYLLINTTIGYLEEEKHKLAQITPFQHKRKQLTRKIAYGIKSIYQNQYVRVGAVVAAIVVILVVLPMFDVFSYDVLNQNPATRKVYVFVKKITRAKIYDDLKFDSYKEYMDLYSMDQKKPQGYVLNDPVGQQDKNDMRALFDAIREDREPMESNSGKVDNGLRVVRMKNRNFGEAGAVFGYMIFPTVGEAKVVRNNADTQIDDPMVKAQRFANVVYLMKADNESERDKLYADVLENPAKNRED